jgi:hypothetical protein
MRSNLKKLMAVFVPVLTAFAVAAGPVSASPQAQCNGKKEATAVAIGQSLVDLNGDGVVCQMITPSGKVLQKDDR